MMRTRLSKIIGGRLVVSTLLLGSAVAIEVSRPDSFPVDPFVFLIGLTYTLSVVYLALLRFAERSPALIDLQFAADAVLVSAFIHVTGGITSNFSSLYVLPIIASSTVRSRRGALQVAALSATLYMGIVTAQYLDVGVLPAGWWLPVSAALPTPRFAQYTVAINLSGMFAVAVLVRVARGAPAIGPRGPSRCVVRNRRPSGVQRSCDRLSGVRARDRGRQVPRAHVQSGGLEDHGAVGEGGDGTGRPRRAAAAPGPAFAGWPHRRGANAADRSCVPAHAGGSHRHRAHDCIPAVPRGHERIPVHLPGHHRSQAAGKGGAPSAAVGCRR